MAIETIPTTPTVPTVSSALNPTSPWGATALYAAVFRDTVEVSLPGLHRLIAQRTSSRRSEFGTLDIVPFEPV